MTFKLGAKEAADKIRSVFSSDRSARVDPEQAHQMKFAKDVARELGADETPESVSHIVQLLREHGIELHAGHEFPKYATRKWDRTSKVVHSEQEENDWINEPQPEPVSDDQPLRTLDAPVQDLNLDLRRSVPHMADDAPQPLRVPRVPSAVTNREAAQDAHARQPSDDANREAAAYAYDQANPGLDSVNQDAARGHGEFVHHDDEIEELASDGDHHEQGGAPYARPADVGVMAHDDPDRDGFVGQDTNPTHDGGLGTQKPQRRSGDSSAGKTDTARRPVGTGSQAVGTLSENLRGDDEPGMAAMRPQDEPTPRRPIGTRRPE